MEKIVFYLRESLKELRVLYSFFPVMRISYRILWMFFMLCCVKRILILIDKIIKRVFQIHERNLNDPCISEFFPNYSKLPLSVDEKSVPSSATIDSLKSKLSELMETKRLYTNCDLTANDICRELAINRTYFSKIIQLSFQTGFRDFLNKFRLEKAKELMSMVNSDDLNLLAISEQAGFRNYGTFNAAFKKEYGITPGEWKRNQLINQKA